jgi:hydrogenase expression/formation protein HypC
MCLAVPGQILSVSGDDPLLRTARVSFAGVIKEVSLGCLPEAGVGDYVIVHAGMALSVLDQAEAAQVLRDLEQLAALQDPPESPA